MNAIGSLQKFSPLNATASFAQPTLTEIKLQHVTETRIAAPCRCTGSVTNPQNEQLLPKLSF